MALTDHKFNVGSMPRASSLNPRATFLNAAAWSALVNTTLDACGTRGHSVSEAEPLTACFGVACLDRRHCARYASVSRSQASPTTFGTCFDGKAYPLFVRNPETQSRSDADLVGRVLVDAAAINSSTTASTGLTQKAAPVAAEKR